MELRIFCEPQLGATYDELLTLARASERLGFDGFFRSDHYLYPGSGSPRPGLTDAWTTLAGLARETSRITLGTLVSAVTFRLPGPLAVTVAQVDQMSGGRVELGLGAGWSEPEHAAFGIPFPPIRERFDRLDEQLRVISGIWTSDGTFAHNGVHYPVIDAPNTVRPARSIPIIIGGHGLRRTPELALKYASEFNTGLASARKSEELFDNLAKIGPDHTLVKSNIQAVCVGRDEAEVNRRAGAIGREPEELRRRGLAGTPTEVVDKIGALAAIGVDRLYLQVLDITDIEQLELIASDVLTQV